MKSRVFFVHGGGSGAYKEDRKLATSLQAALGTNYKVLHPRMPKESAPEYKLWKAVISRRLAKLSAEPLLVGHSVGGAMLLKYLLDAKPATGVAARFLLAAPYIGAGEKWRDDTLQVDFAKPSHLPRTFLFHCQDDKIVPVEHVSLYARKLPDAVTRTFRVGGHQFRSKMSEIAASIKEAKCEIDTTQ